MLRVMRRSCDGLRGGYPRRFLQWASGVWCSFCYVLGDLEIHPGAPKEVALAWGKMVVHKVRPRPGKRKE